MNHTKDNCGSHHPETAAKLKLVPGSADAKLPDPSSNFRFQQLPVPAALPEAFVSSRTRPPTAESCVFSSNPV
jgi:hypothetical protein